MNPKAPTKPAASTLAPKLKELQQFLPADKIHAGSSYLYFQDKTGQPFTVTFDDAGPIYRPLVVSGDKPGQWLHRFTDIDDCIRCVKFLL